jgi:hypothetical protein
VQETPYRINRIRRQLTGLTKASACSLNAILKFDCPESPHCVYNEKVALRIGQTLHIPLADGVLTTTGDGPAFACLEIGSPGLSLPNIDQSRIGKITRQYLEEAAALTVFDVLVGNRDRMLNLKASVVTPHIKIFRGFDHADALLNIEEDPWRSIERLRSDDLIVKFHPFYGYIPFELLYRWAERIASMEDVYIRECCLFSKTFRAVTVEMQEALAEAMVVRKKLLQAIFDNNEAYIMRPL